MDWIGHKTEVVHNNHLHVPVKTNPLHLAYPTPPHPTVVGLTQAGETITSLIAIIEVMWNEMGCPTVFSTFIT